MRLRVASDLHFEFQADAGATLARELALGDFDALVVAGDLADFHGLGSALRTLCNAVTGRPVIYVLGNHEAYGGSWDRAKRLVAQARAELENLTFLEQSTAFVGQQRFIGCTLWFPHSGQHEPFDQELADFSVIGGLRGVLPQLAADSAKFLADNVRPGDVVVTHHLPHPRSIAPRYARSPLNPYFLHDVSALVEGGAATLWIHGHTHESCDYLAGTTRVLCNPFGYARAMPGEPNPAFRADFDASC